MARIPLRAKAPATRSVPKRPMAGTSTVTLGSVIGAQEPSAKRMPSSFLRVSITAGLKSSPLSSFFPVESSPVCSALE